jgi:hypothetical protein
MKFSRLTFFALFPVLLPAQLVPTATLNSPTLDVTGKLNYYLDKVFSPLALLQDSAEVAYAHLEDNPKEWREGWHGLWRRGVDNVGYDALRNSFMLGLNAVSHEDPRYFRMGEGNFFLRTGYAVTQPLVGHADGGRKVVPWVRFAATFGVAFLSNAWYPDRMSDTRHALLRGVYTLGTDATKSFSYEFWPDLKKKLSRRKPTQSAKTP